MSAPLSRGWRKGARTLLQLAAGGALTGLVSALVGGLAATTQALVMAAWTALVAFAQNTGEAAGHIPVLLSTSGLVSSTASSHTEATVDAAVTDTGEVAGTVTDLAGGVVGEVVGQLGYVDKPADPGPPTSAPTPEPQI